MPTEFDDRDYPLLRLRAYGESTDRDIAERIAFLQRHLERREPIALVFDSSSSRPLTASQRKQWTDWLSAHDALIRRYAVGCAIVATSALVRGVFTAVFWLWNPPMPYTIVGTVREAEAWARERLAAREAR